MTTRSLASVSKRENQGTLKSKTRNVTESVRSQDWNQDVGAPHPVLLITTPYAPPTNRPAMGLERLVGGGARTLPLWGRVCMGSAVAWLFLWFSHQIHSIETQSSYPGVLLAQDPSCVLRSLMYLPQPTVLTFGLALRCQSLVSSLPPIPPCPLSPLSRAFVFHLDAKGIMFPFVVRNFKLSQKWED